MFSPPQLGHEVYHDPIRLADWIELNVLEQEEVTLSITSIIDQIADTPPDDSSDSEQRDAFWDSSEEKAEAAFLELSQRAGWLGGRYPLQIDRDIVQLNRNALSRKIYQFLVLLRARQLYEGALGDNGGESGYLFEELVTHALGAYAGSKSYVRFGVAGGYRGGGLPDPVNEAVQALSQRMAEKLGQVSSTQPLDYGADAIAWKPTGDGLPGQLVLICQATISEEHWMDKEPANRWTDRQPPDERLIRFVARPLTAVAFPETLSLTKWDVIDGLTFRSIPFDRLRLLSVLGDDDLPNELRDRIDSWCLGMNQRLPR